MNVSQTTSSGADGDIFEETKQDRSGIFEQGRITVATGRSSISQSTSAADGLGSTGGLSPWLLGGGVLALGAFVYFVSRR